MIVLAGPNGAGKSTLYQTRVKPSFAGEFINADIIQRDELCDASPEAAYKAARIAAGRRDRFIAEGRDFVAETVFSHPSKLDLVDQARAKGFTVIVMHVGVNSPDLSVARVSARVHEGGHPVPEHKIRERYLRSGSLIRLAVSKADRAMVYDNSRLNMPPTQCLIFNAGQLVSVSPILPGPILPGPILPGWIRNIYAPDIEHFQPK